MYNLGNLALSIHGRGGGLGGPDVEEEDGMVGLQNNLLVMLFLHASTADHRMAVHPPPPITIKSFHLKLFTV